MEQKFRRIGSSLVLAILGGLMLSLGFAQIEITFWTHEDPNRTPLEERLIAEFEAAHPEVSIERSTYPSGQLGDTVLTAFAAGRGPTMFNLLMANLTPYLEAQRLAPASPEVLGASDIDEVVARYVDGALNPMMRNGQLFGLPLELTNWTIFINDRIFRDAGLDPDTDYPTTWEKMMAVSEQIVIRDGEIIERRGFDHRYANPLIVVPPMVEQLGGRLISEDGQEAIINDEAWLQVLEYFQEWSPYGRNLGSPSYAAARSRFNFDNNEIAMTHTGQYQIARIRADNEEFFDSGEWRIVPFPRWENAVNDVGTPYYGHFYVVNGEASAEEQEMAWRFIEFLNQHAEAYWSEAALIIPTHELVNSEAYLESPYADVFADEFAKASPVYHGPGAPRIDDALGQALEAIMLEGMDPEQVLETLRQDVQRALDGDF